MHLARESETSKARGWTRYLPRFLVLTVKLIHMHFSVGDEAAKEDAHSARWDDRAVLVLVRTGHYSYG